MRKYILLLALLLSACSPAGRNVTLPTATITPTPLPTTCQVYSMKSWAEMKWQLDGSFSQIPASDGGVTIKLLLDSNAIKFLQGINGPGTGSWSWQWAADAPTGRYYQSVTGVSINSQIWWNWVAPPSPDQAYWPGVRNVVCISKIVNGMAYMVALPKQSSLADYQKYAGVDWLVQKVYGNWAGMPAIWNGFMFAPDGGYPLSGASNKQFYFPASWLLSYVRTDQIPWRVTATNTPQTPTGSPTIAPATGTPTLLPSTPTFTPSMATPTRTPECHSVPFANINESVTVCVP